MAMNSRTYGGMGAQSPEPDNYYASIGFSLPGSGQANSSNGFTINIGQAAPSSQGAWLVGVGVRQASGFSPPGRYFFDLRRIGTTLRIWRGYVGNSGDMSIPNIFISPQEQYTGTLYTGSNAVASQQFILDLQFSINRPVGGAYLHDEPPFSGPGEIYSNQVGTVAATSDIAVTVPAQVRWKLRSMYGKFTASSSAANRVPQFNPTDGTNTLLTQGDVTITANGATVLNFVPFFANTAVITNTSEATIAIGDLLYRPSYVIGTSTANLATGDQWTLVNLQIEEWAGPQP